jgi:predicted enzyme related to lactoylglutathione lyase
MFKDTKAFSSFSVNDLTAAKTFYQETLGLTVTEENDMLMLQLATGGVVLLYPKETHQPATFTVLNFPVSDIDKAVDALNAAGIAMVRYEGMDQDDKGIARGNDTQQGPDIAWFTDPAGNILAVLQD